MATANRSWHHRFPVTGSPAVLLTTLVLATGLGAQRTWVVSPLGGAGVDFRDLGAAFAAVNDGDRVLVRSGTYTGARLDKAVQVVGEPGATVLQGPTHTTFEVTGIGNGKTCVIGGLSFQGTSSLTQCLWVHDNDGLVVLSALRLELQGFHASLYVANSRAVSLASSLVRPYAAVEYSTFSATRCSFFPYQGSGSISGVSGYQATIELTQCASFGTSGGGHFPGMEAVRLFSSSLHLRGDGNSQYIAGTYNNQPVIPSITGSSNSTLVVDPAVVVFPPPARMQSIVTQRMPALVEARVTTSLDLDLYSPAGDVHALFVALPAAPFAAQPFGTLWLDLPSAILLRVGQQGASERTTFVFPRSQAPAVRGLPLAFQALSGRDLNTLSLSNPLVPMVP